MTGAAQALSRLSALPGAARAALDKAAADAARETADQARSAVPVCTGALRASISSGPVTGGAQAKAAAPYASLIEQGGRGRSSHPFLAPAAKAADFPAKAQRALQEVLK